MEKDLPFIDLKKMTKLIFLYVFLDASFLSYKMKTTLYQSNIQALSNRNCNAPIK